MSGRTVGRDAEPSVLSRAVDEASARTVLEAAAVTGEPFEPDLVAAVAERPGADVLVALDELVVLGLVRATDVPRRFCFRQPLVRHAVYAAAGAG
jgi:predicted ATPase